MHLIHELGQVDVAELEHQEYRVFLLAHHHVLEADDVWVPGQGLEDFDLPQRGNRKTLVLIQDPHLLDGKCFVCDLVLAQEYHSVGPLAHHVHLLELADVPAIECTLVHYMLNYTVHEIVFIILSL